MLWDAMGVINGYLLLLGVSCLALQLVVLLLYLRSRAVRAWITPLYCFVHPLLYLGFIEPGMTPSLPWFRASLWAVFASYWTVRVFGALLPVPRALRRALLHAVWIGCAGALVRSALARTGPAGDFPYALILATSGFVLLVIPTLMARKQLRHEPLPVLDSARATWLALTLAAVLGGNQLLASWPSIPRARIEEAARERDVSPDELAAMLSRKTPLAKLFDSQALAEIIFDPKDDLLVTPALLDHPAGPLHLTLREAMMAVRQTGTPWSKQLRPTPYDVPKLIAGSPLMLGKTGIFEMMLSDTESPRIGALVLASRAVEQSPPSTAPTF
jgi:hypothetical protein